MEHTSLELHTEQPKTLQLTQETVEFLTKVVLGGHPHNPLFKSVIPLMQDEHTCGESQDWQPGILQKMHYATDWL